MYHNEKKWIQCIKKEIILHENCVYAQGKTV